LWQTNYGGGKKLHIGDIAVVRNTGLLVPKGEHDTCVSYYVYKLKVGGQELRLYRTAKLRRNPKPITPSEKLEAISAERKRSNASEATRSSKAKHDRKRRSDRKRSDKERHSKTMAQNAADRAKYEVDMSAARLCKPVPSGADRTTAVQLMAKGAVDFVRPFLLEGKLVYLGIAKRE
jgi:hypothetical protein